MNSERFNRLCRGQGYDAVIATSSPNVLYVSGFHSDSRQRNSGTRVFSIAIPGDPPRIILVLPVGSADLAVEQVPANTEIRTFGEFFVECLNPSAPGTDGRLAQVSAAAIRADPFQALSEVLRSAGLDRSKVLLDESGVLAGEWNRFAADFGGSVGPGYGFFREVRLVKSPEEVEQLRKGAILTYEAIDYCLTNARQGMTENEAVVMYQKYLLEKGAGIAGSLILFGDHAAYSGGEAGCRRLKRGDIIRFDSGCTCANYVADLARTAFFGTYADPGFERVAAYHRAMLMGTRQAVESIRPGVLAKDIFQAAVDTVRRNGVPYYNRTHCGHSIGLETYDAFVLGPKSDLPLEVGMVLCVETPYYEIGFGGIQVEDTIVVTDRGAEYLSPPTKELEVLGGGGILS